MNIISTQELKDIEKVLTEVREALHHITIWGISTGGEEHYNALHLVQIENNVVKLLNKLEKI